MFAARSSLRAIGEWEGDAHSATAIEGVARSHEVVVGDGLELG